MRIHGPPSFIDQIVVVIYWFVIGELPPELGSIRIDYPTRSVFLILILETLAPPDYFNPESLVAQAGRLEVVRPKSVL